ncbi:MAG: hypothetical protein FJ386_00575 [Verrucomicrobia bacterium]|nr:hypothetical protein [Verrucomicrobiota bacterium]
MTKETPNPKFDEPVPTTARRSVFENFAARRIEHAFASEPAEPLPTILPLPAGEGRGEGERLLQSQASTSLLQDSIDLALARSFLHRLLACAFADPTEDGWRWLGATETRAAFGSAIRAFKSPSLEATALGFFRQLTPGSLGAFTDDYLAAFGHAARGGCPLNEIEYGELRADPLIQPHRLADLAAFYRAFGLEVGDDASERQDHVSIELEFMSVLAVKEALALEHQLDEERSVCREAQRDFLREHLGRWAPAFGRRLQGAVGDGALGSLGTFLVMFIELECVNFGVPAGGEDVRLRPVDDEAERLCANCGLQSLPPGALAAT